MEKKTKKKAAIAITIALLALASLACLCSGGGAIQDVFNQVQQQLESSGSTGGGIESGYPVFDGGDGYNTTVLEYVGVGGSQTNYISGMDEAHNYLFDASSGQSVTVSVYGGTDETDTRLTILDPNGNAIADADDVSGLDPIVTFTANMAGVFTARIDTFSQGSYTIYVE